MFGGRRKDDAGNLLEQAVTAWRPRTPEGAILPHPAWADLLPNDRMLLFDETVHSRAMEAALDPQGLSTTGRSVLARITGRRR